jgi:hypothetical protein
VAKREGGPKGGRHYGASHRAGQRPGETDPMRLWPKRYPEIIQINLIIFRWTIQYNAVLCIESSPLLLGGQIKTVAGFGNFRVYGIESAW